MKAIILSLIATAAVSAIPKTMQAVAIDRPGAAEKLAVRTVPVPAVGASEVLIAVNTASVASWDIEIRRSMTYINNPKYPYCWDNPKGGFYADYVAVSSDCVTKIPKGISLDAAGALGASGLTALSGVDRVLKIRRGARVLATASGEDGVALVRRLGADVAIDGPYDALFGDQKDQFAQLNQAVELRHFEVPIAATFSLADAAAAHRRVEAGRVPGKVVLKIR